MVSSLLKEVCSCSRSTILRAPLGLFSRPEKMEKYQIKCLEYVETEDKRMISFGVIGDNENFDMPFQSKLER